MNSHTFLQIFALSFCAILLIANAEIATGAETDASEAAALDYELSPAAAEFYRQIRGSPSYSAAYRRLPWTARIRPGMAGGFRKRVSERDINNMLKNTWLG